MITITVFTVKGSPTFTVPAKTKPAEVRQMVKRRFGYRGVGLPHSWIGVAA